MTSGDMGIRGARSRLPTDGADPFVGRAPELERISLAGEALRYGRGQVVVVSGEAGIGKTRLCAEAAEGAARAGMRVVTARCWLDGGAPPLWPWQSILDELCADGGALLESCAAVDGVGPDRFARFVAVTDCLAKAAVATPVCLVVDDVQGADYGALLLIRFVARSLDRFPLLLVLGRRVGEPAGDRAGDGGAVRLLDEIEQEATPVTLGGFDLAETEAFLAGQSLGALDHEVVATLHGLTRGHPLHLRRAVQTMRTAGSDAALDLGLGVAIRQAFESLGPESRRLLSVAAVLGIEPSVAETAEVAGCEPVTVLDAVADGAVARLVDGAGDGTFSFAHELVRATVEDHLDTAARLQAHARASTVLVVDDGAGADRLARAAYHARQAAPRSELDADWAVVVCEAAAQAMVRSFAYERGDELFSAAVELHSSARLGPAPALLVLQWAQAAALRGHMRTARDRYTLAIERAEAEGRPVILAEAALGVGGVWLDDYPTPSAKAGALGLYARALDTLPADDPRFEAQRCRLRARLAAEAAYTGGPVEDLHDAVGATRACGDARALAEALSLTQHALFTQEHTNTRLALSDELVDLAAHTDQGVRAPMGLLWRTVNQLHAGDPQFVRSVELLREQATALGNEHVLYHVGIFDVLAAIGQGRLVEAEAQAARCGALGEQIGRADAVVYQVAQLATIRWLQGRDAELVDQMRELATSPVLADTEFSVWAMAACLAARAGEHDQARAILGHCLPSDLRELRPSGTWTAGLVALVEAAAALGDRRIAAQAYDLLTPYASLPAVAGLGIVCLGSVERSLGVAAGVLGAEDRAVAHLERAVTANHRLLNRSLLVVARAELAAALARRGRAEDRDGAARLLRQAVADGTEIGLTGRVASWQAQLADLSCDLDGVLQHHIPVTEAGGRGVIGRDGGRWTVGVDGSRIRVPDLVGMRYLAELLMNPDRRIPAVMLADRGADRSAPARQEMLDDQARGAYAARARELAADLADAEAGNDLHRAELLRGEIDILVEHLEEATGLGGRPRHFPDDHERARVAVQKAIKRAVDAVGDADPALAELLRQTISTGVTCTYRPDRKAPVTWSTDTLA